VSITSYIIVEVITVLTLKLWNAGQPHTLGETNLLSVRKETLPVCFAPRGQNTNMCYVRSEFIEPPAPSEVIPMYVYVYFSFRSLSVLFGFHAGRNGV